MHPFKQCTCCKAEYTREAWAELRLVGYCLGLELRDCTCRSTLATEVEPEPG